MRIYVAGPLTQGDVDVNIRNAALAGIKLMKAGYSPLVPHLNHYMSILPEAEGLTYEDYMKTDLAWIRSAHALLRLPGYSPGAMREVKLALLLKMPVFHTVEDAIAYDWWEREGK